MYFAGWKHHVSVYPVPMGDANFEQEIEPYRAGKGTLKFPLAEPISYGLIEQVVTLLLEERRIGGAANLQVEMKLVPTPLVVTLVSWDASHARRKGSGQPKIRARSRG